MRKYIIIIFLLIEASCSNKVDLLTSNTWFLVNEKTENFSLNELNNTLYECNDSIFVLKFTQDSIVKIYEHNENHSKKWFLQYVDDEEYVIIIDTVNYGYLIENISNNELILSHIPDSFTKSTLRFIHEN